MNEMSERMVELVARRLSALAEPTRIKLLNALREGEASVGELSRISGTTQQNVSRHLGLLHAEGILERRRDGNFVKYRIADEGVFAICDAVCDGVISDIDRLHVAVTSQ